MSNYKQLTYEQRCQIEVLKKSGLKQGDIADAVGVSQSTISRELSRNTGLRGYRHKQAQAKTDERRRSARKALKMTAEVAGICPFHVGLRCANPTYDWIWSNKQIHTIWGYADTG